MADNDITITVDADNNTTAAFGAAARGARTVGDATQNANRALRESDNRLQQASIRLQQLSARQQEAARQARDMAREVDRARFAAASMGDTSEATARRIREMSVARRSCEDGAAARRAARPFDGRGQRPRARLPARRTQRAAGPAGEPHVRREHTAGPQRQRHLRPARATGRHGGRRRSERSARAAVDAARPRRVHRASVRRRRRRRDGGRCRRKPDRGHGPARRRRRPGRRPRAAHRWRDHRARSARVRRSAASVSASPVRSPTIRRSSRSVGTPSSSTSPVVGSRHRPAGSSRSKAPSPRSTGCSGGCRSSRS